MLRGVRDAAVDGSPKHLPLTGVRAHVVADSDRRGDSRRPDPEDRDKQAAPMKLFELTRSKSETALLGLALELPLT